MIHFVGECGTNCLGGDFFFFTEACAVGGRGSFYVIVYSLFYTSYV